MDAIKRLVFVVFFVFGGFLFYVPKWLLFGTKGGRERKQLLKMQREQLDIARRQEAAARAGSAPAGNVDEFPVRPA